MQIADTRLPLGETLGSPYLVSNDGFLQRYERVVGVWKLFIFTSRRHSKGLQNRAPF